MLVRRDEFRASKIMAERVRKTENIEILYNTETKEVLGDGQLVTGVKAFNNKTNEELEISCTGFFVAIGHKPNTDIFKDFLKLDETGYIEYEQPGIGEISGANWKGKADIVNHDEKLIIDLKTTADINKFRWSASKYNYDNQAYIYQKLFGYEMVFIAIDKKTNQIGIFDCSPQFLEKGKEKVEQAVEAYNLFYKNSDFDPQQFFINQTL